MGAGLKPFVVPAAVGVASNRSDTLILSLVVRCFDFKHDGHYARYKY